MDSCVYWADYLFRLLLAIRSHDETVWFGGAPPVRWRFWRNKLTAHGTAGRTFETGARLHCPDIKETLITLLWTRIAGGYCSQRKTMELWKYST